jgi:hypothetical protein
MDYMVQCIPDERDVTNGYLRSVKLLIKLMYIEKIRNDNIWDRKRKYWTNPPCRFYGFLASIQTSEIISNCLYYF